MTPDSKREYTPGPWIAVEDDIGGMTTIIAVQTGLPVATLGVSSALNPADVSLIEAVPLLFAFVLAFLAVDPSQRGCIDLELIAEEAMAAAKGGVS